MPLGPCQPTILVLPEFGTSDFRFWGIRAPFWSQGGLEAATGRLRLVLHARGRVGVVWVLIEPGALGSGSGVLGSGFRLLVRGRFPDLAQGGAAAVGRQVRVATCVLWVFEIREARGRCSGLGRDGFNI